MGKANSYADTNGVYHNKLGINDAVQLKHVEYDLTAQRSREIIEQNVLGDLCEYGLERQKAIHQHLFQDIYEWAGKTRTVPSSKSMETSKPDFNIVSVFTDPSDIISAWRELEKKTQAFAEARGLTFEQKREALADIFIEANHIHPFSEGNGRSLQVFMKELARKQGIELDYNKTNFHEWNKASAVSGTYGELFEDKGQKYLIPHPPDSEPIRKIFSEMASPSQTQKQDFSGLMRACEAKAKTDGLTEAQRAVVMTRARQEKNPPDLER
ncbi:MAG: Fic family protein [Candidatus Accumulibacter sp.]|jgi:cell filamentation protein|nr:Fic family protein [Accumulibacter sp.]